MNLISNSTATLSTTLLVACGSTMADRESLGDVAHPIRTEAPIGSLAEPSREQVEETEELLIADSTETTSNKPDSRAGGPNLIFDFSDPTTARHFNAVDDRVMGGVSRSALIARGSFAAFEGELSTDRGGGFASVRSDPASTDLSGSRGIELHVRGDGRIYEFRMRTDNQFDGVTYQASFATTAGAWAKIPLPFEAFQPTYRGRVLSNVAPLDPSALKSFGLLVADGQVGSFRLEIEWVGTLN